MREVNKKNNTKMTNPFVLELDKVKRTKHRAKEEKQSLAWK